MLIKFLIVIIDTIFSYFFIADSWREITPVSQRPSRPTRRKWKRNPQRDQTISLRQDCKFNLIFLKMYL